MRCRRGQLVGLVLLLGFGLATSGCSLLFVDGPPPRPRRPDFDCSSTYSMPALDTGLALLGLGFVALRGSLTTGGTIGRRHFAQRPPASRRRPPRPFPNDPIRPPLREGASPDWQNEERG